MIISTTRGFHYSTLVLLVASMSLQFDLQPWASTSALPRFAGLGGGEEFPVPRVPGIIR